MDWQPIARAPKDGRWVWLYGERMGEDRGVLAFWPLDDDADAWVDSEAASYPIDFEPTHWAPFEAPS